MMPIKKAVRPGVGKMSVMDAVALAAEFGAAVGVCLMVHILVA